MLEVSRFQESQKYMLGKELPPPPPTPPTARPTQWKRKGFARLSRWIGLLAVGALYFGIAMTFYYSHFKLGKPMSPKEPLLFGMVLLITGYLLPQFVLEADLIRVDEDFILVKNLLFSVKENWSELKGFWNPPWLNFAVLKGKKFIYIFNKRDIPGFAELTETIVEKAPKLLN